jgi:hypothetical protein
VRTKKKCNIFTVLGGALFNLNEAAPDVDWEVQAFRAHETNSVTR